MPGLAQRNDEQISNASSLGLWSKNSDVVSYNQLQKFWSELSLQARQDLLKIDKQTLFEQARKNSYCSRCNGLLLEGFLQIVMYGKSLQQEGAVPPSNRSGVSKSQNGSASIVTNVDEIPNPSVHPWGGLITARDGSLTILDCYLYSKSLKGIKNVFDSARDRERERELLYPDACGGGGRGWISQGTASYGRVHGMRETCALHTARLSCETLVNFWSALGEETPQSLLRMKEEDFIERLMYRFDSKRFCRDCRRNVIREFKELKELKRLRKEPRCTSWFCAPNTDIQYEVSHDTIQADWHQKFADKIGSYHHFEWAVGSGEGKSDILEFENVGMNGSVHVDGLDLGDLRACYITLRAWKLDGRCSELSFKAHALKNQQCVHSRLVVGDGFVTITRGESIRRFFEHAEEAEEEEDDDSMDKDGNELNGECSRPQKHAKSPELAREFLLDAATVIFKEQVEKAFREGTACQNAHSMFVCLALKLLEDRVYVACKEIITMEKQMKLLEEEEKEKREKLEEEERKERRRTKEREKKLRKKERLKEREKICPESNHIFAPPEVSKDESSPSVDEEQNSSFGCRYSVSETGDNTLSRPWSPDNLDEQLINEFAASSLESYSHDGLDGEATHVKEENACFTAEQLHFSSRRLKFRKEVPPGSASKWGDRRRNTVAECGFVVNRFESRYHNDNFETPSRGIKGSNMQLRVNAPKSNGWNSGAMFNEKFQCSNGRSTERYFQSCSCNQGHAYREKVEPRASAGRVGRDFKPVCKSVPAVETSKQFYRGNKYNQMDYTHEASGRPRSKNTMSNNPFGRDLVQSKKVWEPMESQKKNPPSNSDFDDTLKSSTFSVKGTATDKSFADEADQEDDAIGKSTESGKPMNENCGNEFSAEGKDHLSSEAAYGTITNSSSSSDNCSSCLSEGDSNAAFSNHGNLDTSSTSDSEDVSQQSEGRDSSVCIQDRFSESHDEKKQHSNGMNGLGSRTSVGLEQVSKVQTPPMKATQISENGIPTVYIASQHQGMFPPIHNRNIQFPMYQAPPSIGYYHQSPVPWPSAPANGYLPFTHSNHYLYASPLGYGVNGDSRICMQYGVSQHLATPVFNPSHRPVYQPLAKTNGMHKVEQAPFSRPKAEQGSFYAERLNPGKQPSGDDGLADKSAKVHMDNNCFSLFHSGGPIALTLGCKSDPVPSKDGIVGGLSSPFSAGHVESDCACNMAENTIEEYNLFAKGSIEFSLV